jgi:hypothetical protein
MPEITKYMNEPLSLVNCNEFPGCYYAQAIALHQKYLASQHKEQLGRNAGELYCKVILVFT